MSHFLLPNQMLGQNTNCLNETALTAGTSLNLDVDS